MNQGIFGFPKRSASTSIATGAWLLNTSNAIRVDEYTVAGTYDRTSAPSGANFLTILAFAGGGGGQGGGARLVGTVPNGGGGGGGGGTALVRYAINDLPQQILPKPLILQVVVGAGGAGGAARNTTGDGNGGSNGGASTVSLTNGAATSIMRLAYCQGGQGNFGSAGQSNGLGGSGMNMGMMNYNGSGSLVHVQAPNGGIVAGWSSRDARFPTQFATSTPGNIPLHPYICSGGGSGGVVNTDGTTQGTGGAGGTGFFYYEPYLGTDGGTGAGRDATLSDVVFGGCGGGGGYSATVAQAINAYNGGAGIRGGGGGGGGGIVISATPNTYSSGAGGAGGAGYVLLIWEP